MSGSINKFPVSAGWRVTAAAAVVAFALAGCSSAEGETPGPEAPGQTAADSVDPAGAAEGEPEVPASGDPWCKKGPVTDQIEVTYGEPQSVSDAGATRLGVQWRQYVPATVTNVSDKACRFQGRFLAYADPAADAADTHDDVTIPLRPGQSAHLQLFDLTGEVDEQDAELPEAVEPELAFMSMFPLLQDYYETELDVAGLTTDGDETYLEFDVSVLEQNSQMPERLSEARVDSLTIVGLDADGDIITLDQDSIDPPMEPGESQTMKVNAGPWQEYALISRFTLDTYDDVVQWELARLEPFATIASRS